MAKDFLAYMEEEETSPLNSETAIIIVLST